MADQDRPQASHTTETRPGGGDPSATAERDEGGNLPAGVYPNGATGSDSTTKRLRGVIGALNGKLEVSQGIGGITEWLSTVEDMVADIAERDVERTRREIRELIEKLLDLNMQLQNLARLKQMLT